MVGIRAYQPADEQAIVDLSLLAWSPVFASLAEVLGGELLRRLRGDWRADQERTVRTALADPGQRAWVAERDGRVVGFASARTNAGSRTGEIFLLAADPGAQGEGIGSALVEAATDWLRRSGMELAMVETGGDPGHAPARRVYEKAGYTPLPVVRYFLEL